MKHFIKLEASKLVIYFSFNLQFYAVFIYSPKIYHCFYHFPTKLKSVYAFGLFVCPSVHALILVNILQMSWNSCLLLISDIAWNKLKMVCMGLTARLQRHTKVSGTIRLIGGILKSILTYLYYTKYNEINMYH